MQTILFLALHLLPTDTQINTLYEKDMKQELTLTDTQVESLKIISLLN